MVTANDFVFDCRLESVSLLPLLTWTKEVKLLQKVRAMGQGRAQAVKVTSKGGAGGGGGEADLDHGGQAAAQGVYGGGGEDKLSQWGEGAGTGRGRHRQRKGRRTTGRGWGVGGEEVQRGGIVAGSGGAIGAGSWGGTPYSPSNVNTKSLHELGKPILQLASNDEHCIPQHDVTLLERSSIPIAEGVCFGYGF